MTCTTEIGHGVVTSRELNAKLNIGDVPEIGGAISREVIELISIHKCTLFMMGK